MSDGGQPDQVGFYTYSVRSVADDLRDELRERVMRMDPAARIELALTLGEQDVDTLMKARGISSEEAKRVFAHARAAGRVPSRCADPDAA